MAATPGYPPGVVQSRRASANGEQAETEGGGLTSSRKRARSLNLAKGRSRNLVIPDDLFEQISVYAIKAKVKVRDKRGNEYQRSPNVSEAVCMAIESYLAKIAADEKPRSGRPPAAE
jgi:hypothetical protein